MFLYQKNITVVIQKSQTLLTMYHRGDIMYMQLNGGFYYGQDHNYISRL